MKSPRLSRFTHHVSRCLLAFLVAATLLITTTAFAQVVDIPDPNLKQAIRETLQLPAGQPITQQQMLQITVLTAVDKDISDLTGLKYATNLHRLKAWRNRISDISPLKSLARLTTLNLWGNQIQDISPLAHLTNLTTLDLAINAVETVEPLAGLTQLQILNLSTNQIVDITPLANLTNLTKLIVSRNQLRDLNPLAGLTRLTFLNLSNNRISNLTPLVNLTALETLRLHRNAIVDITPLIGLKNLKELWIADNPIGDFTPLLELEGVELDLEVDLNRLDQLNNVVEVPDPNLRQAIRETLALPDGVPLTQLEMLRLQRLKAWERDIKDLTGLQYATNLELLALWDNQITDLSPLANLTKLTELNLAYNAVESVEPLAGLINLQTLNLTQNRVQDITPLAHLINLEFLYIRANLVTDITPIQGLNLIDFRYDEICDFPPIAPPVRERIESRTFPSVFAWRGSISILGFDHLTPDQRIAYHDLDFGVGYRVGWDQTPTEPAEGLGTSLAGYVEWGRETHKKQLHLNPNLIVLFPVSYRSYFSDKALPPGSDFWLRDSNGEIVRSPAGSPQLNFLKPEVQDLIAKRIIAVERCGLYDGVFLDQFANNGVFGWHLDLASEEEIIQAILNIFRSVREQTRDDFLIIVNANRSKATRYTEYVNGTFMETGSDNAYLGGMRGGYTYEGLIQIESTLLWSEENLRSPQINCLEGWGIPAEPPDSPENRRWMRVITTLSLTHSDGYVMYNTGWGSVEVCHECPYLWGPGHDHIWYDFWDADLGRSVGPKAQHYQNINGLFIREFTNGWAVYNRSGTPQTITLPTSAAPVSNRGNNAASTTHLLPDLDGEIYLKAKNPADVNGDGNVNILDLVQVANNFGKSDLTPTAMESSTSSTSPLSPSSSVSKYHPSLPSFHRQNGFVTVSAKQFLPSST